MKRYFILALIGLILGLGFGYLGVRLDHYSENLPMPDYNEDHWWELLMIPSIPGYMVAMFHWDYDWGVDEGWDYRWAITGFNGLFWMIFIPTFSFYTYLAKCLWRDVKSLCQKYAFLAKLYSRDRNLKR
jgi:hypothetical protein